tara:strand:+ start:1650 stop:2339 length:690 start_codon:yes stop_codon:yes gene_type:complete
MNDFHRYSSWGRTRRLKNIAGVDGTVLADQAACPTDEATGNDVVRSISAVSKSGDIVTLTFSEAAAPLIVAGDVIHITNNNSLKNRTFEVVSRPADTTLTIRLPQDMKNITPQAGGSLRRRTKIGYATENQRFLHLMTAGANGAVANVWAYTYATGIWTELKRERFDVATETEASRAAAEPATDLADVRTLDSVALAAGAPQHLIVEVAGIDRLAFNIDNTAYAAMSTF